MILAASPNTIRSLARKAGLRAADVYIEDISQSGRATEVILRDFSLDTVDWFCDIRDRYPRLVQCQTCGHLEEPDSLGPWCKACELPV